MIWIKIAERHKERGFGPGGAVLPGGSGGRASRFWGQSESILGPAPEAPDLRRRRRRRAGAARFAEFRQQVDNNDNNSAIDMHRRCFSFR